MVQCVFVQTTASSMLSPEKMHTQFLTQMRHWTPWQAHASLPDLTWQVAIHPTDKENTAVCTQDGLLEFNIMPFGLCKAPATFQKLMDYILADLQWQSCLVYLDDAIILRI